MMNFDVHNGEKVFQVIFKFNELLKLTILSSKTGRHIEKESFWCAILPNRTGLSSFQKG
jgi:hypothetical protein